MKIKMSKTIASLCLTAILLPTTFIFFLPFFLMTASYIEPFFSNKDYFYIDWSKWFSITLIFLSHLFLIYFSWAKKYNQKKLLKLILIIIILYIIYFPLITVFLFQMLSITYIFNSPNSSYPPFDGWFVLFNIFISVLSLSPLIFKFFLAR